MGAMVGGQRQMRLRQPLRATFDAAGLLTCAARGARRGIGISRRLTFRPRLRPTGIESLHLLRIDLRHRLKIEIDDGSFGQRISRVAPEISGISIRQMGMADGSPELLRESGLRQPWLGFHKIEIDDGSFLDDLP